MAGKLVIFSAPSGAGKSTIVNEILKKGFDFEFSISACTRKPREGEKNGEHYYFLSIEDFKHKIANDEFVEWEEVYENNFYGTLKSEVERISKKGKNIIFDIDVKGGINIKRQFNERALSIFIMPPSVEELRNRLKKRGTDTDADIERRIKKAEYEMSFADEFDVIIVNDDLQKAIKETENIIKQFLEK